MVHQRLVAAPPPQVELAAAAIVVVVGGAIGQPLLDAWPRGEGAAAAEGNSIYEELTIHIAAQAAEEGADRGGYGGGTWTRCSGSFEKAEEMHYGGRVVV